MAREDAHLPEQPKGPCIYAVRCGDALTFFRWLNAARRALRAAAASSLESAYLERYRLKRGPAGRPRSAPSVLVGVLNGLAWHDGEPEVIAERPAGLTHCAGANGEACDALVRRGRGKGTVRCSKCSWLHGPSRRGRSGWATRRQAAAQIDLEEAIEAAEVPGRH